MPGEDGANRKRGRIERRGDALRVRVYAGDDPVTGKRVYRSETVPGTDRAAHRRAEKTLTRLLAEVDRQRAPTSTVTLTYVLDEWLRSVELEDTTRRTYVGYMTAAVSVAFTLRGDFPWRRVPAYIVAQLIGAILATLLLWALLGKQGSAGLTLPGAGISTTTAMLWELVLTTGLVSVILGTASGAQQIGPLAAIGVGSYIALAGLWGAPVSGASMNPARSLGPALVLGDWTAWWAYLVGPVAGAAIAVGIAYVLRGRGGGRSGVAAAQGILGAS